MIDKKKIQEAAQECRFNTIAQLHAISTGHMGTVSQEQVDLETELIEKAFHAGADWLLDNLWLDANEEPDLSCQCFLARVYANMKH